VTRKYVYKPYVQELLDIESAVAPLLPISAAMPHRRSATTDFRQSFEGLLRNLRTRLFQALDIVSGRALLILRGRAF
jgi:hypothetical protein